MYSKIIDIHPLIFFIQTTFVPIFQVHYHAGQSAVEPAHFRQCANHVIIEK